MWKKLVLFTLVISGVSSAAFAVEDDNENNVAQEGAQAKPSGAPRVIVLKKTSTGFDMATLPSNARVFDKKGKLNVEAMKDQAQKAQFIPSVKRNLVQNAKGEIQLTEADQDGKSVDSWWGGGWWGWGSGWLGACYTAVVVPIWGVFSSCGYGGGFYGFCR